VCVIAGALLNACQALLEKGIHPTQISESFMAALVKAEEILQEVSTPLDLADREQLIHAVDTCLSSKVCHWYLCRVAGILWCVSAALSASSLC